jgi:hypothetical protein
VDNPVNRSAAPLSEESLAAAEAELGLTLPAAYRDFLLQHNGGVARRDRAPAHRRRRGPARALQFQRPRHVGGGAGEPWRARRLDDAGRR